MRKTRITFVINSENTAFSQELLDLLDHYEAVTALYDGFSKDRVKEVHNNNKSVAFISPYQMVENLRANTIVLNVVKDNSTNALDYLENVIVLNAGLQGMQDQLSAIADKYQIDLGDYIPEQHEVEQPTKENCLLCKIYREGVKYRHFGGTLPAGKIDLPQLMNTILYESEHFYLVPAKGSIVEGYTMLVPKNHVWSFAALPYEQLDEAMDIVENVKSLFAPIYGENFVIFEHGSGAEGKCKHEKAIVHAHLHIVPYSLKIPEDKIRDFHLEPLHDIHNLHQYSEEPYLLYTDSSTDWHISCNPEVYIPRQCVRQLIGDQIGLTGSLWNWRKHICPNEIESTVMNYYRYLRSSLLSLDHDIVEATDGFLKEMELRKKL